MMRKFILVPIDRYNALTKNIRPSEKTIDNDETPVIDATPANAATIDDTPATALSIKDIVDLFPKRCKQKANALLSLLDGHVHWNDKGEVSIGETLIPNSHICDLIRFFINRNVKSLPIGHTQFGTVLSQLNVPRSLVVKTPEPTPPTVTWYSV